jgi:hypothetical protein
VISEFRVTPDPRDLSGLVASMPAAWRTLTEIAGTGGHGADRRIIAAVNTARQQRSQNGTTLHQLPQIPGSGGFLPIFLPEETAQRS